jgi:hypothetical protein
MISFFLASVNPVRLWLRPAPTIPLERPNLAELAANEATLPQFVQDCPVAMKYLRLLAPLDWVNFPERPTDPGTNATSPWPVCSGLSGQTARTEKVHVPFTPISD